LAVEQMKSKLLMLTLGIILSFSFSILPVYAIETFDGKASFERVPEIIIPDESQNQFMRINDESLNRQSLQTGETISESGTLTAIIMGSLGPILIVLFIVIYAVKKRTAKKSIEEKK